MNLNPQLCCSENLYETVMLGLNLPVMLLILQTQRR